MTDNWYGDGGHKWSYEELFEYVCGLLGPPMIEDTGWWWYWAGPPHICVVHSAGNAERIGPVGGWCIGEFTPLVNKTHRTTLFTDEGQRAFKAAIVAYNLTGGQE